MATATFTKAGDSLVYAIQQGTDKMVALSLAPVATTTFQGGHVVVEGSVNGGVSYDRIDGVYTNAATKVGGGIDVAKNQTFVGGVDAVNPVALTHVRMRVESWQGGSLTASALPQTFTVTPAHQTVANVGLGQIQNVILNQPSAAVTVGGNTGPINIGTDLKYLAVGISITALSGTSPTLTVKLETQGADGVFYPVWTSSALSAAGGTYQSIGEMMDTSRIFSSIIRLSWVIGGSATPTVTFSASIFGR